MKILCYICGKPARKGQRTCRECHAKRMRAYRRTKMMIDPRVLCSRCQRKLGPKIVRASAIQARP